jgi:hypothetical protein
VIPGPSPQAFFVKSVRAREVDSREGWGDAVAGQAALLGGEGEKGGHGACQEGEKQLITNYFEFRRALQTDWCRSGTSHATFPQTLDTRLTPQLRENLCADTTSGWATAHSNVW